MGPEYDHRARQINAFLYVVEGRDGKFDVYAPGDLSGPWKATERPGLGLSADEAEAFLAAHTTTFPTLREALSFALARVGVGLGEM